jgi:hypothetical protein
MDTGMLTGPQALQAGSSEVGAGAPEPARCSVAAQIRGFDGGWCMVRPFPQCTFGFVYGFGYLCRHPGIERIIARTKAKRAARARQVKA